MGGRLCLRKQLTHHSVQVRHGGRPSTLSLALRRYRGSRIRFSLALHSSVWEPGSHREAQGAKHNVRQRARMERDNQAFPVTVEGEDGGR